ncbi:hypothetical protein [Paraclostridium sp. AKS81]|uniref:hypothetical protein n=1 Tax=Paraclostridium sp. AKS81 TaxID=2876117 RepID=UPI0021E038C2|nr:hypothetical protein [Paraclostridium sp. AKS81]MCU9811312.1 hypothetical protein [Paraclostridium sp. AKS81]
MGMKEFCDHLYDDSTDGYIQILKLNNEENKESSNTDSTKRTIEIYNTRNEELRDIVEVLHEENDVFVRQTQCTFQREG